MRILPSGQFLRLESGVGSGVGCGVGVADAITGISVEDVVGEDVGVGCAGEALPSRSGLPETCPAKPGSYALDVASGV